MRPLLLLLAFLSVRSLLAQTAPPIENSYDLRRFLVGTTWTWGPKPDGADVSEITFTADGKVKHKAFLATFSVLSKSEVELRWTGKVARLHFDPDSHLKYTGEDFGNSRPLYGALRPAGSSADLRELTAAAFAGTVPAATPTPQATPVPTVAVRPSTDALAIDSDLKTLVAQHAAAVAVAAEPFDAKFQTDQAALLQRNPAADDKPLAHQHAVNVAIAAVPINKKFQADLAALLKRAEQSGDAALALKLRNRVAALSSNLDGSAWIQVSNYWAHALRFAKGTVSIEIGGHPTSRQSPYQMNNDGFATFQYDGRKQEITLAPDRTSLHWGHVKFVPE